MTKGFFITGTDTGIGKTFITCLLARAFIDKGVNVGVMKPVETGCVEKNGLLVPSDAVALKEASGSKDPIDTINPYKYSAAIAPNIAARMKGEEIDFKKIKTCYSELSLSHELMLVEGAGGLMAPLTENRTFMDLVTFLNLPVIIVAPNRLGVINHTLLTVGFGRCMDIDIKGIILNNPVQPEEDPSRSFNLEEIRRLSGKDVLGEVPYLDKKKKVSARDYINLTGFI